MNYLYQKFVCEINGSVKINFSANWSLLNKFGFLSIFKVSQSQVVGTQNGFRPRLTLRSRYLPATAPNSSETATELPGDKKFRHSENAAKTQTWTAVAVYVLIAIMKKLAFESQSLQLITEF